MLTFVNVVEPLVYRCWWCDCTTTDPSWVRLDQRGKLICTLCVAENARREAHAWLTERGLISHPLHCGCVTCAKAFDRYYS